MILLTGDTHGSIDIHKLANSNRSFRELAKQMTRDDYLIILGDFGLVWDGTSIDTCAGNYGTYLKYNDPHKTSLYLVCGFPVVVWEKSAISRFVLARGAGIAVASLLEAGDAIAALSPKEYEAMCKNAAAVSAELRSGSYLKRAVAECMKRLDG